MPPVRPCAPRTDNPLCPLAAGTRHDPAMRRIVLRSSSGRRSAPSHRLDICAAFGTDRSRIRCVVPQRVSRTPHRGCGGVSSVRDLVTVVPRPPSRQGRGRQRTDSTPILADVWALNRLEAVGDTWRHALHRLAVVVPEDEVFNQGLSALQPGRAVCTLHAALSTADADHPAREAISGPASGPTTGSDRRVSGGVCSPCRH